MEDSTPRYSSKSRNTLVDPVTNEVRQVFEITNYVVICGIISLFGIGSNIVNICVFAKQGFKDSINISLLGLAIADLACSLTMFWGSICYNPLFHKLDLPIAQYDVTYVTSAMPHVCFNRITSFITAFITLERCLCIAMPLKVKIIITPFRTKIINATIFIFTTILFCPFYFVQKLQWKYNISRNRTILSIFFTSERGIVDSITFFAHSVLLSSVLLIIVIVCTIILVVKLNKKTKWRSKSSNAPATQDTVSTKDKKVVKMITLIAAIFIVCYIPPTINFLIMSYNVDFNITGRLKNILYVIWSMAFILEAFNSSVNIFVYFKMSSKFKETFLEIFCSCFVRNKHMM